MARVKALLTVLVGLLNLHTTLALPTGINTTTLRDRDVPADSIEQYSYSYFISNARVSPASDCLFYSGSGVGGKGLTDSAIAFARSNDMTTIWDLWSCDHYWADTTNTNNRLRGIFANPITKKLYFRNMSQAFAYMCEGTAWVMLDNPPAIPEQGIFYDTEYPQLTSSASPFKVSTIYAISEFGGSQINIFTRPQGRDLQTTAGSLGNETLGRRREPIAPYPAQTCFAPGYIYEAFPDMIW